ncbi:kinase-like domain-containing protein [Gigaspora rosea]|uniref:Kinase-like domain-containing protein n=1 Tax=Gigaspora rosea TaxID=44941 RepID=A0A397VTV0_9GLOM|nr:kinase-like domain-containing protein [Gigaspora rosea]
MGSRYSKRTVEDSELSDEMSTEKLEQQHGKYGECKECMQQNTGYGWCMSCNANHFQELFDKWTSGNNTIDRFVQNSQLSATNSWEVLEWVPYERFFNVKYLGKGGYGVVYSANWDDGCIKRWDDETKQWSRFSYQDVVLKSLRNSRNLVEDFLEEINAQMKLNLNTYIIPCYGITKDPKTDDFMIVMKYASDGSLRQYLNKNLKNLKWGPKLNIIRTAAEGLYNIHKSNLTHKNLHSGNIVIDNGICSYITDFGIYKPEDYESQEKSNNNQVYGVLPYVAPEVLYGDTYTQAADIYSFGILMNEVASELPPYYNIPHNYNLALQISQGYRPKIKENYTPQLISDLIKRCWDARPELRPTANELHEIFGSWYHDYDDKKKFPELWKQIEMIEKSKDTDDFSNENDKVKRTSYITHHQATYTSCALSFANLSQPVNASDILV